MATKSIIKVDVETQTPSQEALVLSSEEKNKIADLFNVLIQVDRRLNITGVYGNKPNK